MPYETLLLRRDEHQDYSAAVRPEAMRDGDVAALSAIFNAASHTGRLKEDCPALYCFPVGAYVVLVRHYCERPAQAAVVVEGVAVKAAGGGIGSSTAAKCVVEQASLLKISAETGGTDLHDARISDEREFNAVFESDARSPLATALLERREQERLFLPFNSGGRAMLAALLADSRFETPLYFAFGTNSDVLAQLEPLAAIDVVSFFKTERVSLRDRATNQVTQYLDGDSDEPDHEATQTQRMKLYAKPHSNGDDAHEDTRVGSQAMPIQRIRRDGNDAEGGNAGDTDDPDDSVLTREQIPTGTLIEESDEGNPLRRVTKKLSSLLSLRKTE